MAIWDSSLESKFWLHRSPCVLTSFHRWWIHPVFAFHAGIIASPDPTGGISADDEGAYAILMSGKVEESETPDLITYVIPEADSGKWRLMNCFLPQRPPVRILRSQLLESPWRPIVGVRYDGLYGDLSLIPIVRKAKTVCVRYKPMGWSAKRANSETGTWTFRLTMQRLRDQPSIHNVLRHPTSEEHDDYYEYKRIRYESRLVASMTVMKMNVGVAGTIHENPVNRQVLGSAERRGSGVSVSTQSIQQKRAATRSWAQLAEDEEADDYGELRGRRWSRQLRSPRRFSAPGLTLLTQNAKFFPARSRGI